jgi:hypothetical protein
MGFFSFFNRRPAPDEVFVKKSTAPIDLEIDLGWFRLNGVSLGEVPTSIVSEEVINSASGVFELVGQGIEIGTEHGVFDHAFITVADFTGTLSLKDSPLTLSPHMTERDILAIFGEPYWTDRTEGETLLFYEYLLGQVELQFEFPDAQGLTFVTFMRNGVLSVAEQRAAYGVTKPWPPA